MSDIIGRTKWLQRVVAGGESTTGRLLTFLCVLLGGAIASWAVFHFVQNEIQSQNLLQFEQQGIQTAAELQTNFNLSLEQLFAIPQLFAAADSDVTQQEYSRFVSPALRRHPSIYTTAYLPRVPLANRAEFEAKVRASGIDDFSIRSVDADGNDVPLEEREAYFPIFLDEPLNYAVAGIDLGSHPEQGPFVERACRTEQVVCTPPLSLIEDPEDVLSVIAFAPVRYPAKGKDQRCDGVAMVILRVRPVVEESLGTNRLENLRLVLMDSDTNGSQLVHKNFPGDADTIGRSGWPTSEHEIKFADQTWTLTIAPAIGSPFAPSNPPYWILLTGFLLSLLAAYSLSAMIAIGGLRQQVDEAMELGRYQLGAKLGEGAMGSVYQAKHEMLARPAAIKLIRPDGVGADETWVSRFEREAQATASLQSAHTVSVFDFGKTADGTFYYVMERLDGIDLAALVHAVGPLPAARTVHILRQICRSLAEAHETGLIHRDIKPANIFICQHALEYDFAKVLDFGLVNTTSAAQSAEITQAGTLLGTPAYMAPEMIKSESVDNRADIYSLGCVAHWLLTAAPVFSQTGIRSVIANHLTEPVKSLRTRTDNHIPPQLDALILRCLAKDPADRPKTALALEAELAMCINKTWTQAEARDCWEKQKQIATGSGPTQLSSLEETILVDQ